MDKKIMPLDIEILEISIFNSWGLIPEKIPNDSKEILLRSKMGIFMKKPLNLTNFKINNFLGIKIQERKIF